MASTQSAAVLQGWLAPRCGPWLRQTLQRLVRLVPRSPLQAHSSDVWKCAGDLQMTQCSHGGATLTVLDLAGQRGVVEGVDWQPLAKHFDVTFFSSPHDLGTARCGVSSGPSAVDAGGTAAFVAYLQERLHSPASALRLEVPPQLAASVFLLGKRCTPQSHIFCSAE